MASMALERKSYSENPHVRIDEGKRPSLHKGTAWAGGSLSFCRKAALPFLLVFGLVAGAADYTWTNLAAGVWNDPANWLNGAVGGGSGSRVNVIPGFSTATQEGRQLQVPDAGVTVGSLQYLAGQEPQGAIRIWGGPITLDNGEERAVVGSQLFPDSLIVFAPLQGTGDVQLSNVTLTGPAHYAGNTYMSGVVNLYSHCYAERICETVTNQLPTTKLFCDSCTVHYYSHCSWDAFDADFALVEGSRLAVCTEGLFQKGVGTPVTGEGVPAGAFFRASISGDTLELNEPATRTGTFRLHVGGVAPWQTSIQRFEELNVTGHANVILDGIQNSHYSWEVGKLSGAGHLYKNGYGSFSAGIGADFSGGIYLGAGQLSLSAVDAPPPVLPIVSSGSATLEIGEDLTVSAKCLAIEGRLVKTGAGTLAVNSVGGTDPNRSLDVREGQVVLGTTGGVQPRCPVTDAWFHVDASDIASFEFVEENGTKYVTRWNDTDGGAVFATAGTRPFIVTNALANKAVLDFGSYHYPVNNGSTVQGYGGSLTWSQTDGNIREVFMVYADTDDVASLPNDITGNFLLGDSDEYNFHRGLEGRLFIAFTNPNITGGLIEVDGESRNQDYVLPAGFHLIHLRTTGDVRANAFARNRNLSWGGQRIAEVLVFNRVLTDDEAAGVHDYLDGKWFGGPATYALKDLTIAGDASLTVDTGDVLAVGKLTIDGEVVKRGGGTLRVDALEKNGDAKLIVKEGGLGVNVDTSAFIDHVNVSHGIGLDAGEGSALTVGKITGDGALVKRGAGRVAVGSFDADALDVQEGTLRMGPGAIPSDAFFHVDASDAASLETVLENGTNYVARWNDTNGGAVFATANVRPFLNTNAIPGKTVVDFGSYNYPGCGISGYGASMTWNLVDGEIREVFLVFSDTDDIAAISDATAPSFFLGHTSEYHFHRGLRKELFIDPYASANLRDGLIEVDNCQQTAAYALPGGFHLVHLRTTANVAANTFAYDRGYATGGQRLAEVIVYNRVLDDAEVAGVQQALLSKWWGTGRTAQAFEDVSVAAGATLDLSYMDIAVGNLACVGTLVADEVAPSALTLVSDGTDIASFTLEGAFSFAANGTVYLVGEPLPDTPARYLVADALDCTGGGLLKSWLAVGEGLPPGRSARLIWVRGQLFLDVSPSGINLIFR